jgi:hypothetical protein
MTVALRKHETFVVIRAPQCESLGSLRRSM